MGNTIYSCLSCDTQLTSFRSYSKERVKSYTGYFIATYYQNPPGQRRSRADSLRAIDNLSASWHNRQKD
jgi:hypothetical protein